MHIFPPLLEYFKCTFNFELDAYYMIYRTALTKSKGLNQLGLLKTEWAIFELFIFQNNSTKTVNWVLLTILEINLFRRFNFFQQVSIRYVHYGVIRKWRHDLRMEGVKDLDDSIIAYVMKNVMMGRRMV